jgi:uncharacterized protein
MQSIIEQHRAEIVALCRCFHVRRLEAFGSATRDDFDSNRSDIDLLVEFHSEAPLNAFDLYFGLKEALEALIGRPVDLLVARAVTNPYLRANFERSKETLYAA